MNNEGFLRIDRLLALLGIAVPPVFLLLFEGGSAQPFLSYALFAAAAAAVIAEAGFMADRAGLEYALPRFSRPLLLFAGLSVISVLWGSDKGAGAIKLNEVLLYLLAFWAASRAVAKARKSALFIFLTLSTAILGWFIASYAASENPADLNPFLPFAGSGAFMAFSIALLAISLAVLLAVLVDGMALSESASLQVKAVVAAVSIAGGIVSSAAILISASQAYLALTAVAVLIVFLLRIRRKPAASLILMVVLLGLGLLASWLLTLPMKGEAVTFLPAFAKDARGLASDLEYLSYHWMAAIRLGLKSPLWGFGSGSFKDALSLVYVPAGFKPGADAQSFVLQLFAEMGLLGLTAFLAFAASAAVSMFRRLRYEDSDAPLVMPSFAVLLMLLFVGGVQEAPLITLIFFLLGGFAAADRPLPCGRKGWGRKVPAAVLGLVVAFAVLIAAATSVYFPIKEEGEHMRAHGEHEEALAELKRAAAWMPFDSGLYIDMADSEAQLAIKGLPSHSLEKALDYAKRAITLSRFNPAAYEIRGAIRRAITLDGPWLDDYKLASKYSGASVAHDLQIAEWGLLNGKTELASQYVGLALPKVPALMADAAMTVEGIQDLTNIVRIYAASYAAAYKGGDPQKTEAALDALREFEARYPSIHEFVHQIIHAYDVEDALH